MELREYYEQNKKLIAVAGAITLILLTLFLLIPQTSLLENITKAQQKSCANAINDEQTELIPLDNRYPQDCLAQAITPELGAILLPWTQVEQDYEKIFFKKISAKAPYDYSECLNEGELQVYCEEHELSTTTKSFYANAKNGITLKTNRPDRDNDGIADAYDGDSDNDGIMDWEDEDIDGDGIKNTKDKDTFGQNTVRNEFQGGYEVQLPEQELKTNSVYVTVKDINGDYLSGITVTATDENGEQLTKGTTKTVTSKGIGILGIIEGENYKITAKGRGYTPQTSESKEREVIITLTKGLETHIITETQNGLRIPFAKIKILNTIQLTDAQGQLTIYLPEGTHTLTASTNTRKKTIGTVVAGTTETIKMQGFNGTSLEVGVVTQEKDKIEGRRIIIENNEIELGCVTDKDSTCFFNNVPNAEYQASIIYRGKKVFLETFTKKGVTQKLFYLPQQYVDLNVYANTQAKSTVPEINKTEKTPAEYQVPEGKTIHVEASALGYQNTKTLPFSTSVNKKIKLNLVREKTPQMILVTNELSTKEQYYASIIIPIEGKWEAEFWVGEEGTKNDDIIVISEINVLELLKNNYKLIKSNELPAVPSNSKTSKYVKFFGQGQTELKIPFITLEKGKTTLNYNVNGEKGKEEVSVYDEASEIEGYGNFSKYKTYLTTTKIAYEQPKGKISAYKQSKLYLHVEATAEKDLVNYNIPIEVLPSNSLVPNKMSATIHKVDGRIQELGETDYDLSKLGALQKGEKLDLVIEYNTTNELKHGEIKVFDETLDFEVLKIINLVTGIEGLETQVQLQSRTGEEWKTFELNDVLPSNEEIRIKVLMKNSGTRKTLDFNVVSTGLKEVKYEKQVDLNKQAEWVMTAKGIGEGEVTVFMDGKALFTITHGNVVYDIIAYSTDEQGRTFPMNSLSKNTMKLEFFITRNGKIIDAETYDNTIRINPGNLIAVKQGTKYVLEGRKLTYDWIKANAQSQKFSVNKQFSVGGLVFAPRSAVDTIELSDDTPYFAGPITYIQNKWEVPVEIDLVTDINNEFGHNVEALVRMVDSSGNKVEGNKIPARGAAEVILKSQPVISSCNDRTSKNKIKVVTHGPETTENDFEYSFDCKFSDEYVPNKEYTVTREKGVIDYNSCLYTDKNAFLCDAQQFSEAVLSAYKRVLEENTQKESFVFSLARDKVTTKVLEETRLLLGKNFGVSAIAGTNILQADPDLSCGKITVTFNKIGNEYQASFNEESEVWCNKNAPQFAVSLLNEDPDLINSPGAQDFVQPGNIKGIVTSDNIYVTGQAYNEIIYKDFTARTLESESNPLYSWLKRKTGAYYNVKENADDSYTVTAGVIGGQSDCFKTQLEDYWVNGNNSFIKRNEMWLGDIKNCFPTQTPEVPEINDFDVIDDDKSAVLRVSDSVQNCVVYNDENNKKIQKQNNLIEIQNLVVGEADGKYVFNAQCYDEKGLSTRIKNDFLIVDRTPPEISSIPTIITNKEYENLTFEATDLFGVPRCELEDSDELLPCEPKSIDRTQTLKKSLFECETPTLTHNDPVNVTCFDSNGNKNTKTVGVVKYPENALPIQLSFSETADTIKYIMGDGEEVIITKIKDVKATVINLGDFQLLSCTAMNQDTQKTKLCDYTTQHKCDLTDLLMPNKNLISVDCITETGVNSGAVKTIWLDTEKPTHDYLMTQEPIVTIALQSTTGSQPIQKPYFFVSDQGKVIDSDFDFSMKAFDNVENILSNAYCEIKNGGLQYTPRTNMISGEVPVTFSDLQTDFTVNCTSTDLIGNTNTTTEKYYKVGASTMVLKDANGNEITGATNAGSVFVGLENPVMNNVLKHELKVGANAFIEINDNHEITTGTTDLTLTLRTYYTETKYFETIQQLTIDKTPPTLVWDNNENMCNGNKKKPIGTIIFKGELNANYNITIDGVEKEVTAYEDSGSRITYSYDYDLSDGPHPVTIEGWDSAGNIAEVNDVLDVDGKVEAQIFAYGSSNKISLGTDGNLGSYPVPLWIVVETDTAKDNYYEVSVGGTPLNSINNNPLQYGERFGVSPVTFEVMDDCGNVEQSEVSFTVTASPPVITVQPQYFDDNTWKNFDSGGRVPKGEVRLYVNAEDSVIPSCKVKSLDGISITPGTKTETNTNVNTPTERYVYENYFSFTLVDAEVEKTFNVTCTDGTDSDTQQIKVTLEDNTPPEITGITIQGIGGTQSIATDTEVELTSSYSTTLEFTTDEPTTCDVTIMSSPTTTINLNTLSTSHNTQVQLQPNRNNIKITCKDKAQNTKNTGYLFNITDVTDPVFSALEIKTYSAFVLNDQDYNKKITVQWPEATDDSALTYEIYTANELSGSFSSTGNSLATGLSCTKEKQGQAPGIPSGYCSKIITVPFTTSEPAEKEIGVIVKAVDENGNPAYTNGKKVTVYDTLPPTFTGTITFTVDTTKIKLQWPNAVHQTNEPKTNIAYHVTRHDTNGNSDYLGKVTSSGTNSINSFTDTSPDNTKPIYTVIAIENGTDYTTHKANSLTGSYDVASPTVSFTSGQWVKNKICLTVSDPAPSSGWKITPSWKDSTGNVLTATLPPANQNCITVPISATNGDTLTLSVTVADNTGNTGSTIGTVKIDKIAPTISSAYCIETGNWINAAGCIPGVTATSCTQVWWPTGNECHCTAQDIESKIVSMKFSLSTAHIINELENAEITDTFNIYFPKPNSCLVTDKAGNQGSKTF